MRLTINGLTLRTPRTTASLSASAGALLAAIDLPAGEIPWEGILTLEGIETGDERIIAEGALTWADLPLPFTDEHDYEVILGRLDTVTRAGSEIRGSGVFADTEEGRGGAMEVALGLRRGLSVDLDAMEGEIRIEMPTDENGEELDPDEPQDVIVIPFGNDIMSVSSARIRGVALCTIAAFAEAQIVMLAGQPANDPGEASVGEVEEDVALAAAACSCQPQERGLTPGAILRSLIAGAADAPLADWFTDPHLSGPTPVTVDGRRVFGHVATWDVCHTGHQARCTLAPRSQSGYAYFTTGSVVTADGSRVKVGQLTMGCGHAPLEADAHRAAAHYDGGPGAIQWADVAAGEDEHGIWIAGALRPGLTDLQIREAQAQALSGDWRNIGGHLELVAALSVPVPGFPIAASGVLIAADENLLQSESGEALALVAAGKVEPLSAFVPRSEFDLLRAEVAALRQVAAFRTPG